MVLVYLMGLADIFAAIMLTTGLRLDFILYFTIAMLGMKGIASFYGRLNPIMYVMGGADLLAILLLWQSMSLGSLSGIIILIMVGKGLVSFWEIELYRNSAINLIFAVYRTFVNVKNSELVKKSIASKLWFGKPIPENKVYDYNYFYNLRKNDH